MVNWDVLGVGGDYDGFELCWVIYIVMYDFVSGFEGGVE